jgi:peptide/nickel transport system permease protein
MERSPEAAEELPAPSYRRFALERIAASLVVVWLGLTLLFVLFFVVPSDPAVQFAGKGADASTIRRARHDLRLDRSLPEQYLFFLGRFAKGDLGYSYYNRESVGFIATFAAPLTGAVAGGGMLLGLFIGVPVGLLLSRRRRPIGMPARGLTVLAVSFMGFPAALGVFLLAGHIHALWALTGYCDFFSPPAGRCGGPVDWARHLFLPWICLGLPLAAIYVRIVRVLGNEVRADGSRKHSGATLARLLVLDASWIMGATVFAEILFQIPGLGRIAVASLNNFDLPTTLGILEFLLFLQVAIYLVGTLVGGAFSRDWRRT